ncbi:MAG: protein translocase subunit SecF [Kineosporiaceae bacterium]
MARASFSHWGNALYTGERSYDFVGRRRLWYTIAAVVLLLSAASLGLRGLNLSLEFVGGSEFRVSGAGAAASELAATDAVRSVVPEAEVRATRIETDDIRVQTDNLSQDVAGGEGTDLTVQVRNALAETYGVPPDDVSASFVGPSWGEQVSQRALISLLVFLVLVSLAITAYFRTWTMAVAALVALLHDLVITVGVYAAVGFQVSPASVIGFLTILGYSLYDTVVVFDKVRENTADVLDTDRTTFAEAANLAVNQTLVRSINTSVVALLPVGGILFIGGAILGTGTLLDLALALFVGIAVGTYSSIFLATPLFVHLRSRDARVSAQARRVEAKRAERAPVPAAVATGGGTAVLEAARSDGDMVDADPGDRSDDGAADVLGDGSRGSGGTVAGSPGRRPPLRRPSGGQRPQPRRGGRRGPG